MSPTPQNPIQAFQEALQTENLSQLDLAKTLGMTPSKVSRLFAKETQRMKLGEIQALARSLNLHFTYRVYHPDKTSTAICENALHHHGIEGHPPVFFEWAVEWDLQRQMMNVHPPRHHQFTLNGETVHLIGWHLGQTTRPGPEALEVEVYWCTGITKSLPGAPDPTLVFQVAGSEGKLLGTSHALGRIPIDQPNAQGRTYLQLQSNLALKFLGSSRMLCMDHAGHSKAPYLLLGPIDPSQKMDVYAMFDQVVQVATQPRCDLGSKSAGLPDRIRRVEQAHRIPEGARHGDFQQEGFQVQPDSDSEAQLQASLDADPGTLTEMARRYRLNVPWLMHGEGPPSPPSTLPSLGWSGHEIFERVYASLQDGSLEGSHLLHVEGGTLQLVLEKTHPEVPEARVYDHVPAVLWSVPEQRLAMKAVLKFLMSLGFAPTLTSIPLQVQSAFQQGDLLLPEMLHHQDASSKPLRTLLREHEGFLETLGGDSVMAHFKLYGGLELLQQLDIFV